MQSLTSYSNIIEGYIKNNREVKLQIEQVSQITLQAIEKINQKPVKEEEEANPELDALDNLLD